MRGSMAVVAVVLLAAAGRAEGADCPCPEPSPGLDPNYSRLLFAPTDRPLAKGEGSFADYELVFPGVAYGLTDNVSIAGGVSVIPWLGLGEQLTYVSPKVGWNLGERAAVSVGGLFAHIGEFDGGGSLAAGFAVGTFGGRDRSVSVGVGVLGVPHSDVEPTPFVLLGGTATVARHVALVGEGWLRVGRDFHLGEQPIGLGVRFFGETLSADVGVVVIGNVLDEGFPAPWASVTCHFGQRRAGARR